MDEKKCPICGAKAGAYRLGACSPQCDMVIGDEESLAPLLILLAVVAIFVIAVVVTYR